MFVSGRWLAANGASGQVSHTTAAAYSGTAENAEADHRRTRRGYEPRRGIHAERCMPDVIARKPLNLI
jgi:hypothetical protein